MNSDHDFLMDILLSGAWLNSDLEFNTELTGKLLILTASLTCLERGS